MLQLQTDVILTHATHIIDSKDSMTLDPTMFSKFKYGSKNTAREFGRELAASFLLSQLFEDHADTFKEKRIVVLPSPYEFIPTATYALKDYFVAHLNHYLVNMGICPVQESKIYRVSGYTEEYGHMSQDERVAAIGSESFHVDAEFLKGKFLLFLDDIRITGAHQQRIEHMIERQDLVDLGCDYGFIYYAQMQANLDPTIEGYLNYYAMKHLLDLDDIIKNDTFLFNTRNVKYILGSPHEDCEAFLMYQSRTFQETLYHYTLGNSYHLVEKFQRNYKLLKRLATR